MPKQKLDPDMPSIYAFYDDKIDACKKYGVTWHQIRNGLVIIPLLIGDDVNILTFYSRIYVIHDNVAVYVGMSTSNVHLGHFALTIFKLI